jgi:meiotically up-regulated gene 157 (Mug157) protein
VEQRHNATTSPYRFVELENEGLGTPVGYTGMIWSGFRPSDDENGYGYSIPSNMYAAGALQRALELNKNIWQSPEFEKLASKLLKEVVDGIEKYGIVDSTDYPKDNSLYSSDTTVDTEDGSTEEETRHRVLSIDDVPPEPVGTPGPRVYAYEVDGLGNYLTDFDDPNWPSLVSMPLLGYAGYDRAVYETTRKRLLSSKNEYWFEGRSFRGMGSPHTSLGMAWALGTLSEALTAPTGDDKAEKLRLLLKLQCGDGLMHESVHVDELNRCTRKWFEWANALSVVAIEHLAGIDCDAAAEVHHRAAIAKRQGYRRKDRYMTLFHQSIEAGVQWGGEYVSKVDDWKGIGNVIH